MNLSTSEIKTITSYQTSDGQKFTNLEDAEKHQGKLDIFNSFATSHHCNVRQSELDEHEEVLFSFLEFLSEHIPAVANYRINP